MKNRLAALVLVLVLAAGLVWAGNVYFNFVSQTIYDESTAHLTEVFHQANQTLYNLVSVNWSRMRMWEPYLSIAQSEAEVAAYVNQAQEESNFTDFFFISRDGNYITLNGKRGYLELRTQLTELILERKPVIVNSVVPDKPEIMVFAIPATPGSYRGFDYEAIAITFNNTDLVEALKISAFGGKASTFAVVPDGRVVVNNASEELRGVHNIFSMLEGEGQATEEQIATLQEDFSKGNSGAMIFNLGKTPYYLIYESADFQDWIVLGTVPADVVNASMSRLQSTTMTVVSVIAISLAMMVLALVVQQNRMKLRQKDHELLVRDELFSKLSSNVDDLFLMLDAEDFRVDFVSPNIEKLVGIREETIRRDIRELEHLIRGNDTVHILDELPTILPGEQREWDREYCHQTTGEIRWFHVVAFGSDIQGEKKYILVMSDRTINQALEDAVHAAQNASRAKSTFLSNMSHDIRTPMNAVLGFATLAKANMGDWEKISDYLDKILASGNHLLSLINDILDMSRIESGKIQLDEQKTNLVEMIWEIRNIITVQMQEKQLELKVDTGKVRDADVYCDKTRLNQVLLNLLSNAMKFTPAGGAVSLSVAQLPDAPGEQGMYEFRVEDNGIGMSQEFAARIFDPFEREHTSTVSKIQGTGLGMAISKNIIDMMGGSIRVKTRKDQGTEFIICVTLRLQPEQRPGPRRKPQEETFSTAALPETEDNAVFRGRQLLLVEDNALNREIAYEILSEYGFRIDTAENGKEAVDKVSASRPGTYDLVLMDIQMPVMDGYEATRAIRSLENPALAAIPIVAMTANAFDEDRRAAAECGMDGFLSKPIQIDKVFQTLRKVLERR